MDPYVLRGAWCIPWNQNGETETNMVISVRGGMLSDGGDIEDVHGPGPTAD